MASKTKLYYIQENKLATSKILEKEAELIYDYLDRLIDLIIDFTLDQILNFDETRFDWDQNIKYTFDFKGKDRVLEIKSTKINHPITIILAISASALNRQQLTSIVSKAWDDVKTRSNHQLVSNDKQLRY